MNSQPDILTSQDVEQLLRLLPKYRVLLHNDDVNSMDFVVQALLRTVQRLTVDEAIKIMLEAHLQGKALVVICPKETAEFYRAGLESYGLTSTIEPDS
ncbi:MAG TPA: ATP-dependent Clp protease adapter ClpS [Ktedonobacterales bacterium]|nr:ATP-dependent Clp protease adapter ClpS [Ktedonobacterales bacterium]